MMNANTSFVLQEQIKRRMKKRLPRFESLSTKPASRIALGPCSTPLLFWMVKSAITLTFTTSGRSTKLTSLTCPLEKGAPKIATECDRCCWQEPIVDLNNLESGPLSAMMELYNPYCKWKVRSSVSSSYWISKHVAFFKYSRSFIFMSRWIAEGEYALCERPLKSISPSPSNCLVRTKMRWFRRERLSMQTDQPTS